MMLILLLLLSYALYTTPRSRTYRLAQKTETYEYSVSYRPSDGTVLKTVEGRVVIWFNCTPFIIIIITRRQLRSVATTPHDVHVYLHSATSVSSWPVFRCRSAVSRSFENALEVFASLFPDSDRLSLQ